MATQFITATDGTRIAYDVTGRGPALLLLHGAGKTRRDWHKVGDVARLQKNFQVITVDLRGSGDSDLRLATEDYAIEKICADVTAVAAACQASRFALWGYSFGGNVGRYLGAWTDRLSALVVGGAPFGPAIDADFDRFITDFTRKWQPLADAYKSGRLPESKRKSALKGRIPAWVACFPAMRGWPPVEPAALRCPARLLVGSRNIAAMNWVQENRARFDQTRLRLEIVAGLNHVQEFSQIDAVFPVVERFLLAPAAP